MKVVLAYSGGLDTSIAVTWVQEKYKAEVVTVTLELGQEVKDLKAIEAKAKKVGAVKTYSIDARKEFMADYITPAIKANGLYEGKYPLSTALGRPLIAKHLVEIAEKEGAQAVSHGSTGKGNDQVRFDVAINTLNPDLQIIAPARDWGMSREQSIAYAKDHGIEIPVTLNDPYSYDINLWGKSAEAGPLEDPMFEPTESSFGWTVKPESAPDKPEYVTVGFKAGVPVSLNGKKKPAMEIVSELNKIAGAHGVGRIDIIEDRVVGIKSRETYECPAALVLLEAHKELERMTLTRDQILFKELVDSKWAQMVYFGLWFEPLRADLDAFIDSTQAFVEGSVRLKLYKGSVTVVGRESPHSLYDIGLASYSGKDRFDSKAAEGFIKIWGLPSKVAGRRKP
ncbi:MAG: argininosuccinate synthase [Candidatus Altiarchaeota archaeon]